MAAVPGPGMLKATIRRVNLADEEFRLRGHFGLGRCAQDATHNVNRDPNFEDRRLGRGACQSGAPTNEGPTRMLRLGTGTGNCSKHADVERKPATRVRSAARGTSRIGGYGASLACELRSVTHGTCVSFSHPDRVGLEWTATLAERRGCAKRLSASREDHERGDKHKPLPDRGTT